MSQSQTIRLKSILTRFLLAGFLLFAGSQVKAQCYSVLNIYIVPPPGPSEYIAIEADYIEPGTPNGELRWYAGETDPTPVYSSGIDGSNPASQYSVPSGTGTVWVSYYDYTTSCETDRQYFNYAPPSTLYLDYARSCGDGVAHLHFTSDNPAASFALQKWDPGTSTYEYYASSFDGYFEITDFDTTDYNKYGCRVVDDNGLGDLMTFNIAYSATQDQPTINGITSLCEDSTARLTVTGNSADYTWQLGNYFVHDTAFNIPDTLSPGSHILTVNGFRSGCNAPTGLFTITINPRGTVGDISASDTTIYIGHAVRIGSSGGNGAPYYSGRLGNTHLFTDQHGGEYGFWYTPLDTGVYWFRLRNQTGCGFSAVGDSIRVHVLPLPFDASLSAGFIYPNNYIIATGTSPGRLAARRSDSDDGSYTYQWQQSTDGSNFTNISGATALTYVPSTLSANHWYRRAVSDGAGTSYSNVCKVAIGVVADVDNRNYIRERAYIRGSITREDSAAAVTDLRQVRQATKYYDALGRLDQTVVRQGTLDSNGHGRDIVAPLVYDQYGLQEITYLPYVSDSGNGKYKTNPLYEQNKFHTAQYPGESFYFGETITEQSPFNTPLKTMAPGDSWIGDNKGTSQRTVANTTTDSVRLWKVTEDPDDFASYALATDGSGLAAVKQLTKQIGSDEQGKQVIGFTDQYGNLLLKKVQLTAAADDGSGSGYTGWLCTYYIYDRMNRLRCVIQPRGVELLARSNWELTDTLLKEQCFRYEYDSRNRTTRKKLPGAGETWMVYDKRDRLVMMQDANMRSAAQKKWTYVQYDDFNRPVTTGLITDDSHYSDLAWHLDQAKESVDYPDLDSYTHEELTRAFYDDYSWRSSWSNPLSATYNTAHNSYFETASTTAWPYAETPTGQSSALKGKPTGSRVKVVGTSTYLFTVNLYDERGRLIQAQGQNITGGTDIATIQYSWSGQPLVTVQQTQKGGINAQTSLVVTRSTYDDLGRLVKEEKKLSNTLVNSNAMSAYHSIAEMNYDVLGQLKTKKLAPDYDGGTGLETLTYDFNIRGWLLGMNRDYLKDQGSAHFGFELAYDKKKSIVDDYSADTYNKTQLNGAIGGMIWKSAGDGEKRKYDFDYDAANRLLKADFTQNNGGWNTSAGVDYSMRMGNGVDPQTAYDANGNILAMMQKGLKINSSSAIDQLKYVYEEKSNRLKQVTDTANDYASTLGDFKYDGTKKTTTDYLYDADGNLTSDRNKQINGIVYNDLGLPSTIQVTGKGSINYFYNAAGMKLVKITRDSTSNPVKIDSTLYLGGGVFQNDTLQFIGQEEGRIRFNPTDSSLQYDYFLRDHLGNVRMVLTEEQRTDAYPAASLETASLTTEKNFYARLDSGRVNKSGVSGYPSDTYTSPNDYIQKLSGSGVKIGAGIVLKVMAGDEVGIRVSSWYKKNGSSPGTSVSPLTDLLGALTTGIGGITSTHGGATITQLRDGSILDAATTAFLGSHTTASGKPKAYVNWLLFDEQFKLVSASSGFEQVGNDEEFKTHTPPAQSISKNGFLYIYVSNETPNIDVFFDNLQVTHTRGPLLEESHYYPFGLTMAGISNKSAGGLENKYKFNSGTELNSSFDINLYETNFRSLDPQLGRFWQVDPKAEGTVDWSTYAFANNNPLLFADPLGLDTTRTLRPKENADIGDIWMPFGDGIAFSYQGDGSWGLVNIIELENVTIRSGHYDPLDTKGHHTKSTEEYLAMTEGANEYFKEHETKPSSAGISWANNFGQEPFQFYGSTVTNAITVDNIRIGSASGTHMNITHSLSTTNGPSGLLTIDHSTSDFDFNSYSATVAGVATLSVSPSEHTISGGLGARGYDAHIGVGAFKDGAIITFTAGYSYPLENGTTAHTDGTIGIGMELVYAFMPTGVFALF